MYGFTGFTLSGASVFPLPVKPIDGFDGYEKEYQFAPSVDKRPTRLPLVDRTKMIKAGKRRIRNFGKRIGSIWP